MDASRKLAHGSRVRATLRLALAASILSALPAVPAARAADAAAGKIPDFLEIVVDRGEPATKAEVAAANVVALDSGMQRIYADTLVKYKEHMRGRVPVIIGLFSETGGSMILYPPDKEKIVADPVPPLYAWLKSVSHAAMAIYQLVAPYLLTPGDDSWRAPMMQYQAQIEAAMATLPDLDVPKDVRERLERMLEKEKAFMQSCLDGKGFSLDGITKFAHDVEPDIVKNVALAARTQVEHWEKVLGGWQKMLGKDWDETYAITNTLYVTQQNNVLFTILAQFMGEEAIDDRLILTGTTEFTTTPETMLELLTRIVADRAVGKVFFRNYYLMDAELLGGAARHAIEAEAKAKGKKALLPKLAPFHTHAWPWPTDPDSGAGPATMEEIPGD